MDDFLPPEPEPEPEPEAELDPEPDPDDEPEEPEEPEELEDSDDFPDSDLAGELSVDEPLEPLAAPSLPAATVLEPFRLSVR